MGARFAQIYYLIVLGVITVTPAIVVRVATIFPITSSVFSVTPPSAIVPFARRMASAYSATQIVTSTLLLTAVPNALL